MSYITIYMISLPLRQSNPQQFTHILRFRIYSIQADEGLPKSFNISTLLEGTVVESSPRFRDLLVPSLPAYISGFPNALERKRPDELQTYFCTTTPTTPANSIIIIIFVRPYILDTLITAIEVN